MFDAQWPIHKIVYSFGHSSLDFYFLINHPLIRLDFGSFQDGRWKTEGQPNLFLWIYVCEECETGKKFIYK